MKYLLSFSCLVASLVMFQPSISHETKSGYAVVIAVCLSAFYVGEKIKNQAPTWIYGNCNGQFARRHAENGVVQFVLWKAGEQGHEKDYWHNFDVTHWHKFQPY